MTENTTVIVRPTIILIIDKILSFADHHVRPSPVPEAVPVLNYPSYVLYVLYNE